MDTPETMSINPNDKKSSYQKDCYSLHILVAIPLLKIATIS